MTSTASPSNSRRNLLIAAIVIAAVFLLIEIIIAFAVTDEELKTLLNDLLSAFVNLVATGALFWAGWRSLKVSPKLGRVWFFFAFAQLAYAVGDVTWSYIELVLKQDPFPSISDGFYLLYYPLAALGILLLPKARIVAEERVKLILDSCMVVIASGLTYWLLLIAPIIRAGSEEDPLSLFISLAYPILDMVLLWALVSLLASPMIVQRPLPIYLLAGGVVLQVLADSIYGYQSIIGDYSSGNWLNVIYIAAYLLAGLAGVVQALAVYPENETALLAATGAPRRLTFLWNLSPYLWLVTVYILLIWDHYQASPVDFSLLAWSLFIVGVLVFLRQAATARENSRLYNELHSEFELHKQTTAELRENETRSKALSDLTTDYVYSAKVFPDGKMKLEWASDAFVDICGYSPAELEERGGWASIVHPEDVKVFAHRREAMSAGRAEVSEYRIINKEQQTRWLRDYGRGEINEEGRLYRILGAAKDISENKRIEQALTDSESRLRRFLNAIQVAILVTDREGRPYMANDQARQLLAGHAISFEPPKRLAEFYHLYLAGTDQLYPADRFPIFTAMRGETSKVDDLEVHPDGKRFRLKAQSIQVRGNDGKVEYVITTFE